MGANRVFTIFGSSEVAHTTLTHACPNSESNPQPNGHLHDSWDHFVNPPLIWNNFHTLWLIKAPVVRRPRILIPGSWLCHTANYLVCPIGLVLYWQTYEIWTAPHMPVLVQHRCVIPGLLWGDLCTGIWSWSLGYSMSPNESVMGWYVEQWQDEVVNLWLMVQPQWVSWDQLYYFK